MSSIKCDCDILHQRFFKEGNKKKKLISGRHPKFRLFFEITNQSGVETRLLTVTDKKNNIQLTVKLNKYGGLNPTPGHGLPTGPANPGPGPIIIRRVSCDLKKERIFYTDINLSAEPGIEIFFTITNPVTPIETRRVIFKSTSARFRAFDEEEIGLNGNGGKKPAENGLLFFRNQKSYQDYLRNS